VGGGCINHATRLGLSGAGPGSAFLKWNADAPRGLLAAERTGLDALRNAASALRIPEPFEHGFAEGVQWLVMEWIDAGREGSEFGARLAEGLAALHATGARGAWGLESDNFIGTLPQENAAAPTWGAFWVERRVRPQLERAFRGDRLEQTPWWAEVLTFARALLDREPAVEPALVHGDLWRGNVFADPRGQPVLVDPAVYRGDGEVDLAMAALFGGFPTTFFDEYRASAGAVSVDPATRRARTAAYQLYPLLVHANLFGGGYGSQAETVARAVMRGGT